MGTPPPHKTALDEAIALEAEGQRLLLSGDRDAAAAPLRAAAARYRASWEAAPPRAFGRLVGYLKAALLARDGDAEAAYVLAALAGPGADAGDSPVAAYAHAIAALVGERDDEAAAQAEVMREGGDAFARTAEALAALARGDGDAYRAAVATIVADFEAREAHLTGVAIADTALMLDALARRRGRGGLPASPVLPR